jgi:hypothetical protein
MTPEYEAERGQQALRLLNDELLVETIDGMETKWTEVWKNSPARDVEGREMAWQMLQTVQLFRKELEITLDRGKAAQVTLAQRAGQMLKRAWNG